MFGTSDTCSTLLTMHFVPPYSPSSFSWTRRILLLSSVCFFVIGPCHSFQVSSTCEPGVNDFPVGPGQTYTSISAVPWSTVGPGDTVRIFAKAEAYKETFTIQVRGTESNWIKICGVPDGNGNLPVIDAQGATYVSGPGYMKDRGAVLFTNGDSLTGYIVLQGLKIMNAYQDYTLGDGTVFRKNAASVYIEAVEHLIIRNCEITGSGNGIFAATNAEYDVITADVLVEGCTIYGNGVVNSLFEHNVYTEANGIIFQYNHFEQLRIGSQGTNLKDRSAGVVIRYNWIAGGTNMIDLVEAQGGCSILCILPTYPDAHVYGNVLTNTGERDETSFVHWGGDGNEADFRKGTLYFYHNTVILARNRNYGSVLRLQTSEESADVRNNVIYVEDGVTVTPTLMFENGVCTGSNNWISSNWQQGRPAFVGTVTLTGTLLGTNPGLDANYQISALSPLIGAAGPLSPQVQPTFNINSQYYLHANGVARSSIADIGAFQFQNAATTETTTSTSATSTTTTTSNTSTSNTNGSNTSASSSTESNTDDSESSGGLITPSIAVALLALLLF